MNPDHRDPSDSPSFSAEIDAICDRFEAAWKGGQQPQIKDYLCQVPESARSNLFRHLLALELHYRKAGGESPDLAEYRERFPDHLAAVADAFPTIDSRAATDRQPAQADHSRSPHALHIRCPHCRNPIEVVDDTPLAEIFCPSCGSNFSIVGDEALAFQSEGGSLHRRQAFGHFELIEQLGTGAFGAVWKARDTQLDRMVAVKIPRKGQLNPEEAEKFVREARAAAQLQHPGIVSVYEVGREDETLYIVSEFVEGLSRADWLTGQRPTYRESAELCVKIADALHHAHEHGVIHRDLKPSNVMLDREGETHVMDFGLAKREAGKITMTVEGQVLGTPAYMSPEQAKGEGHTADRRSNVYRLPHGAVGFLSLQRRSVVMKRFSIVVALVVTIVCFANAAQAGLFFHRCCSTCVACCEPCACATCAPAPCACATCAPAPCACATCTPCACASCAPACCCGWRHRCWGYDCGCNSGCGCSSGCSNGCGCTSGSGCGCK